MKRILLTVGEMKYSAMVSDDETQVLLVHYSPDGKELRTAKMTIDFLRRVLAAIDAGKHLGCCDNVWCAA